MSSGLPGDGRLLEWVYGHAHDSRLRPRLHLLESAVPYSGAAVVYALLALLAFRRADDRGPALRAMAAGVIAWILSNVLKLAVERPRPCLDSISCGNHSFPEGPGMVLAAVAVAIWPRSRPIAIVAAVWAIADAAAQLAYGSHWPSDLLGAWLLGGLCGLVVPAGLHALMRRREAARGGE